MTVGTEQQPHPSTTPSDTASLGGSSRRTARPRTGLSVRTRIVVALAVMVTVALTAAGAIIYVLESARLHAAAVALAEHELEELSTFQQQGDFSNVDNLLYAFLDTNVVADSEMLVAWIDGAPRYASRNQHAALTEDPEFRSAVAALADEGGTASMDSPMGEVLLSVQPIRTDTAQSTEAATDSSQALVVVSFIDDSREELTSLIRTYAMVALLSLGTITLIARWQAGRLLAPLRILNDTARQIGSTDLSRRIAEVGNDDITALTRTVNEMLDRLQSSFMSQRTFLDDAGHELRTPLTVLRTHLELLRPDNATEVDATRVLLLDEVDRMSRLVEDMTLLAKSNRPDFVRPAQVDLGQLTRSAFAKAVALGDRVWTLDATADGTAEIDQQRVTQAILQLADNAVKHTDQDAEIGIGTEVVDGHLRVWVRDTGDGVPMEDRALIFDRFGRGAVREGDDGFGLGLSIVTAIASAHGGDVSITDAEPHGAEFSLVLPLEVSWRTS